MTTLLKGIVTLLSPVASISLTFSPYKLAPNSVPLIKIFSLLEDGLKRACFVISPLVSVALAFLK